MATYKSVSDENSAVENGGDFSVHVFSSAEELLSKRQKEWLGKPKPYSAMYSSIFGGIVIDPTMMVIPMYDHMVHIILTEHFACKIHSTTLILFHCIVMRQNLLFVSGINTLLQSFFGYKSVFRYMRLLCILNSEDS